MFRLSTNVQICISLVSMTISALLLAHMLGLVPNAEALSEAGQLGQLRIVATDATMAANHQSPELVRQVLEAAITNIEDLKGCVWRRSGSVISAGDVERHELHRVDVPIRVHDTVVGDLQFFLLPRSHATWWSSLCSPFGRLVTFLVVLQFAASWLYLRKVLYHLDPSRVVPNRVAKTLDALAEGLIVMDRDQRIVLANRAFAVTVGQSAQELIGVIPSEMPWVVSGLDEPDELPWVHSLRTGESKIGSVIHLRQSDTEVRTFRVNTVPLLDERGECSGAMASFDDVTALQERTIVLTRILARLKSSRDQIRRQNQQLHRLATRDPLTSALNRRSFFDLFDTIWQKSQSDGLPICCLLIDVDYFKSINDTYGHAKGDFVLKQLVAVLNRCIRASDLLCRYGGEEFCVVMPGATEEAAAKCAERYRHEIVAADFEELKVTASFGVACTTSGAESPQKLMDQADQALYAAKRDGRNRVVCFASLPMDFDHSSPVERTKPTPTTTPPVPTITHESPVSFQIVTALTSALAYRDAATAEHSRRVADLCVLLARDLMPLSACYILENAALLHDVGKIGVPDSILLKPGPLAEGEWSIMKAHDQIGVEIIRSTFTCQQLTDIVALHLCPFANPSEDDHAPTGIDIPLGARILSICDAYDAMVTDRVYRRGLSQSEAFDELRRCSGTQFDPELVERFIRRLQETPRSSETALSAVSKSAALRLGVHIENIAKAIDAEDVEMLRDVTQVVLHTSQEFAIAELETLAQRLLAGLQDENEWLNTVRLTLELMELCRQTQRSHLATQGQPEFNRKPDSDAENPHPVNLTVNLGSDFLSIIQQDAVM